jgi:hypothetical protein
VIITRALCRGDPRGEHRARLSGSSGAGKKLSILEVCGNVLRMGFEQRFEMRVGSGGIAGVGAIHGKAVARKRVSGLCSDKFFEHLAAGLLLWLGHGSEARIISALRTNTKFPPELVATNETIDETKEA